MCCVFRRCVCTCLCVLLWCVWCVICVCCLLLSCVCDCVCMWVWYRTWCPRGPMDKASAYEAGDCGFESRRRLLFCCRPCIMRIMYRHAVVDELGVLGYMALLHRARCRCQSITTPDVSAGCSRLSALVRFVTAFSHVRTHVRCMTFHSRLQPPSYLPLLM